MSLKKHIWKGVALGAAMLLSVGVLAQTASAAPNDPMLSPDTNGDGVFDAGDLISGSLTNIRSDGSNSLQFKIRVFQDINGDGAYDAGECTADRQGITVTVTTSRGTLSATSSTTSSTAVITDTACLSATVTLRGNGTTGVANLTATATQPVAASTTFNVNITSGTITPTSIKFRDATNNAHTAANVSTVYTSPTTASQVRFQTTDGNNQGANNQLIQATVDKGNIAQWVDGNANNIIDAGEVITACADNTTANFNSKTVVIDGNNVEGIAVFFVCPKAGQAAGPIKVTAKNLTTTMSDASTTVLSAGAPNKLETTVTGGAITVTVKDKDGNEVADGTTVTAVAPAFSGAVSPTCGTTSNGKVSFSAAASGAAVQVIITAFMNDSGNAPASTCANLGSVAAASTTINVGAGGTTTPGGGAGGFTGAAPARGSIGLLVTNQASGAAGLVSALGTAGCTAESIAVLEGGVWKIYINGAPAVVNSAFPGTVAATTAFFVRCAA